MAPRRGARVIKVERSVDYDNLTVKEVLCPICRSILIEPVTLPCSHVFCSSCFQGTMENANLVCPLCRMRIGSWLRYSKKENKLIDVEYWNAIKRLFPQQIKNKLDGVEENLSYEEPLIQIAKPGELKKEYETLIQKETDSFKKEREAEMKASEALIKKLREEEEYQRLVEEEKLRVDEEIARKLTQELNTIENKNNEVSNPLLSNNNSRKNGPLDRFLMNTNMKGPAVQPCSLKQNPEKTIDYSKKDYTCRILCPDIGNDRVKTDMNRVMKKGPPTLSMLNHQISLELQHVFDLGNHSDSSDSIESECQYFKPIDYRKSIPCQRITPIRVPAMKSEVKCRNISKPKGHCTLKNDTLNSAFAAFGKLSLQDNGNDKKSKLPRQTTKRLSLSTEKSKISPEKVRNINVSPEKKKLNSLYKEESTELLSSTNVEDQNKIQTKGKVNPLVKRKLSKNSPDFGSPSKKNKIDSNNTFSRYLATPSSPFRGFSKTESKGNISQKRYTRNNSGTNIDEKKIKLQVKSDYELAKKLQEHFDNSSYSTRSSAPRRGTKVSRQTTLDSLLSKKYQH